ncbi:MAG TPA: arginine--tRNA ligase [Nevskiaceae bacterium]|nr:arginine--tRNA ligase [Nevskiaceae bacterium]
MKSHLQDLLRGALQKTLAATGGTAAPAIAVDATKDPKLGDFQTNLALQLAKPLGKPPRAVAEMLVANLPASPRVKSVNIAGPGFINFFVADAALQSVVSDILAAGAAYGRDDSGSKGKVMVEFVSANPTGPMHVGHGRNAAYGDALSNLLAATGWQVWREYYINDAGRQIDVLTASVWLRYLQSAKYEVPMPVRGYVADYINVCAKKLRAAFGNRFERSNEDYLRDLPEEPATAKDDETLKKGLEDYLDAVIARCKMLLGNDYEVLRKFAYEDQLGIIKQTLADFGVRFDQWYSERELVESGLAQKRRGELIASGHTYEKDHALWFRTTEHGDDKDRVLVKADGAATYFGNDLAYHVDKLDRGWSQLIDVWGADHHGLLVRMRAALESLTGRKDALRVQLIQFVTLSSGKMGKRSGNFVTLADLIADAGKDATRFFYLMRSHDQHLEFDIDLARSQSTDNPVYYVQYAHARICSVYAQLQEKGGVYDRAAGLAALQRLDTEHEKRLLTALARWPEALRNAATNHAPHLLVHYLKDEVADALHAYYHAHRFIIDDAPLQAARLALIEAARVVLASGLALLGVSAPEKM